MSAKSAQRNGAPEGTPRPPQPKKTAAKPNAPARASGQSVATRLAAAEQEIVALKTLCEQMSRILSGLIENQAVQQAMPQMEQQLRNQIRAELAQNGLGAVMGEQATPQG